MDDDANIREIVRSILQTQGCRTLEAGSGEEALGLIRKDLMDLVLLDAEMEGISGFEVVKRLKDDSKTRPIPVIMITGLADRESRLLALENGAEDYLRKPVDPAELKTRGGPAEDLLSVKAAHKGSGQKPVRQFSRSKILK